MNMGDKIKQRRMELDMTQEALAEKLNVSRSSVANWEAGRNYPDMQLIASIADILGLSLDELLREDCEIIKRIAEDTKCRKKQSRKIRILSAFIVLLLVAACFWLVDRSWPRPVDSTEHLGMLTYEMPGKGYTHAKGGIITKETGFGNEEVIIGKVYRSKDFKIKITISEWHKDWHTFLPTAEYEEAQYIWAFREYKGELPEFMDVITVIHNDEELYYKAYLMTDEKHNNFQYVVTVKGRDYDKIREVGESVIASMAYDESLSSEFVQEY